MPCKGEMRSRAGRAPGDQIFHWPIGRFARHETVHGKAQRQEQRFQHGEHLAPRRGNRRAGYQLARYVHYIGIGAGHDHGAALAKG